MPVPFRAGVGWGGVVWTVFWLAVSGFPNAVAFLSPPVRSADCLGGEPVLGSPNLQVLVDGKVVAVRQRYRQARERPSRVHARDSRGIQSSASAVLQNKGPPSLQVSRFCPRESTGGRDAMATLLPPWAVAVETVLMEHWGSAQAGGMWGGGSLPCKWGRLLPDLWRKGVWTEGALGRHALKESAASSIQIVHQH